MIEVSSLYQTICQFEPPARLGQSGGLAVAGGRAHEQQLRCAPLGDRLKSLRAGERLRRREEERASLPIVFAALVTAVRPSRVSVPSDAYYTSRMDVVRRRRHTDAG